MWKRDDIQFHQSTFSPLLEQYLPKLNLSAGDSILVPLCGKSLDMDFLTDSGYHVVGIELSKIAIQAYFDARNVTPKREKKDKFIRWWHKDTEIWCGDIFNLTSDDIGHVNTLYDCTSLTALPFETRPRYVQHFYERLAQPSQIILITTESADTRQNNSSATIDSEVQSLYEKYYQIELLHGKNSIRQDPEHPGGADRPMEEKVYLLTSNTYSK